MKSVLIASKIFFSRSRQNDVEIRSTTARVTVFLPSAIACKSFTAERRSPLLPSAILAAISGGALIPSLSRMLRSTLAMVDGFTFLNSIARVRARKPMSFLS
ncbi:Uncharacterised protein [uncultured archaeon]|nr:Uncharacterised protein [uncultured archaeon]